MWLSRIRITLKFGEWWSCGLFLRTVQPRATAMEAFAVPCTAITEAYFKIPSRIVRKTYRHSLVDGNLYGCWDVGTLKLQQDSAMSQDFRTIMQSKSKVDKKYRILEVPFDCHLWMGIITNSENNPTNKLQILSSHNPRRARLRIEGSEIRNYKSRAPSASPSDWSSEALSRSYLAALCPI